MGGAVLADLRGRKGKRVVVLEKGTAHLGTARNPVARHHAAPLLSLASQAEWETEPLFPIQGMTLRDGARTLMALTSENLAESRDQPWLTNPNQSRARLLRLGTFEVRRGVEVMGVLKEQGRVIGGRTREVATGEDQELLAHYTVGDDGGHSPVREAVGIPLTTRLLPVALLAFDFAWPAELAPVTVYAWLNWRGVASSVWAVALFPLPQNRGAGLVVARPRVWGIRQHWST